MINDVADRPRRVIPRWRYFSTAAGLGELSSSRQAKKNAPGHRSLSAARDAWLNSMSIETAGDYLMAAVTAGSYESAIAPARFLANADVVPALQRLATGFLAPPATPTEDNTSDACDIDERARQNVKNHRSLVRFEPHNAIAWVDLARAHVSCGNDKHAKQAIRTALALAPNNRFVLRAASRFFVHLEHFDRAHAIVARSEAVRYDPWLAAAEISTAFLAQVSPQTVRQARSILKDRKHAPRDLAELASAVATVDLEGGNRRGARKLFEESLIDPNENAIAQAQWAINQHALPDINPQHFAQPFTFEARSKRAYADERWEDCAKATFSWMADEPFAQQPAALGSFVAIEMLDNPKLAACFAEAGLRTDSSDSLLLNNLAVALARLGEVREATQKIAQIRDKDLDAHDLVVITATRGLIQFRAGDVDGGRVLYTRALELTEELHRKKPDAKAKELRARCRLNWLFEEVVYDPSKAATVLEIAGKDIDALGKAAPPEVRVFRRRLEVFAAISRGEGLARVSGTPTGILTISR